MFQTTNPLLYITAGKLSLKSLLLDFYINNSSYIYNICDVYVYIYIYSYIFDGKTPSLMETNPPTISIYKLQSMRTTMWGPLVISWFTDTMNYSYLRIINHSYWSYVHQLSYHKSAINPMKSPFCNGFPRIFHYFPMV